MQTLYLNHTYLIKKDNKLSSVTVTLITERAYYIRWNNGLETLYTWELIDEFCEKWYYIEDITSQFTNLDLLNLDLLNHDMIKIIDCPICDGNGYVDDKSVTSGKKLCHRCNGNKRILR